MLSEYSSEVKFEIGHVLFIDIVGYSKGLINEQSDSLEKLKTIVRGTEQFRLAEAEGKLVRLPTGDGGALVFRNSLEAPVLCAMEIAKTLQSHPQLRVRMGIHSGPVNQVTDLNEQANIAGAGINFAQRVMDCGDAGHILLSRHVAEDLEHYPQWRSLLHELGECEVKHGVRVSVVNLYNEELGNPEVPEKFQQASEKEQTAQAGPTSAAPTRHGEGFWVAVLLFKYSGSNSDLTALAEGLTEGIVTGLSRFSYLKVISRSSTSRYASDAGKELGARYVMEGSLRQAGTKLRLAVQLLDAVSGTHLWAENYERNFTPESVFELQDDLVPRIVSTVADMHGVLPRSMSEAVRVKAADQMSPYEALLRSFGYNERFTPEDLAEVRTCLERAVQQAPGNAECWAMLSLMYANEYGHWDNAAPDSLDRSLRAARTAVEAAPLHSLPYYALAQALFFKREIPAFRVAAERAISLNSMDGATAAFMGMLIAYAGDWERGCALSDTGCQLNPNHPGWYRYPAWHDAYRKKDYRKALEVALRLNAPQNYYTHAVLAICYAQLGRMEEARKALRDMLALKPNYAEVARELHGRWIDQDLVEQLMDGLRKAGLEVGDKAGASGVVKVSDSGAARADEGFWVAALPFKYSGGNSDLTALAEGLSEDIVTGLSRFSYLKVIARSSTARYASESVDVRSAGKELGARYVMEGSLRQSGTKLRLAVQLVDAVSGAHLWAENYERTFSPETVFELQDDLVPRVVSTCADHFGVLARCISDAVRMKKPEQLSPYEALMRGFGYHHRLTPGEHAEARKALEKAVEESPGNADCWAMLSWVYSHEYAHEFNTQPGALDRALAAAQRAVELAPSNHLAYQTLAVALFFRKDIAGCLSAAERAIALNPLDASNEAIFLITFTGDWERGCSLIRRAMELNPHHPGWYRVILGLNEYRKTNYRQAVEEAANSNARGIFWTNIVLAAAYGQLGKDKAARDAVQALLAQKEDFAESGRKTIAKWYDPELVEHLIAGLRKAGLSIPASDDSSDSPRRNTTVTARADRAESRTDAGQAWARGDAPAKSVAVLPFVNLSADRNDEYLSDGMTEELINALAKVPGLRVPGRTSCFAFKGITESDIFRKVGDQLHVTTVLEGSVRKAGEKLRVTAQLVNVADGYHLWSEDYDGDVRDIFTFQSKVAQRVVEALQIKLGVEAARALAKKPTENPEAHRLYLLGRYEFGKYSEAGWTSSIRYYEEALKLDPNYALAYCGLADTYAYMGGVMMPSKEAVAKEKEFAQRALQLEPQLAEAHLSLAAALAGAFDWQNAQVEFDRAIELNPNLAWAYEIYAWFLGGLGRLDEAIAKDKKAIELDPLNSFFQAALAYYLYHARRYDDAMVQIRTTLELDATSTLAHHLLGCCLLWKGDMAGAIAEFQRSRIMVAGAWYQGLLGYAYAISGNRPKAEQLLQELEEMAKHQYVSSTALAMIYLGLGEKQKALDWLGKSYEDQESACWYLKVDPIYDSVRNEPRFQAILKKIGLE